MHNILFRNKRKGKTPSSEATEKANKYRKEIHQDKRNALQLLAVFMTSTSINLVSVTIKTCTDISTENPHPCSHGYLIITVGIRRTVTECLIDICQTLLVSLWVKYKILDVVNLLSMFDQGWPPVFVWNGLEF